MSWISFKSFSPFLTSEDLFEKIVKRCGRFLKRLSLKNFNMDIENSESILNVIANECTNLQHIDLGHYLLTQKVLQLLQPNFYKVKVFKCATSRIDDNDLYDLFLTNKKLQQLKIEFDSKFKLFGTFLHALSENTLTYLEICEIVISGKNFIH